MGQPVHDQDDDTGEHGDLSEPQPALTVPVSTRRVVRVVAVISHLILLFMRLRLYRCGRGTCAVWSWPIDDLPGDRGGVAPHPGERVGPTPAVSRYTCNE